MKSFNDFVALFIFIFPDGGLNSCIRFWGKSPSVYIFLLTIKNSMRLLVPSFFYRCLRSLLRVIFVSLLWAWLLSLRFSYCTITTWKKITIRNFQSYYDEHVVELSEGVNIFHGDNDSGKSKQDKLADYEADYMKRLEQAKIDAIEAEAEAQIEEAKAAATNQKGGALPKGFEAKPEPPKASTGTLPKGF